MLASFNGLSLRLLCVSTRSRERCGLFHFHCEYVLLSVAALPSLNSRLSLVLRVVFCFYYCTAKHFLWDFLIIGTQLAVVGIRFLLLLSRRKCSVVVFQRDIVVNTYLFWLVPGHGRSDDERFDKSR